MSTIRLVVVVDLNDASELDAQGIAEEIRSNLEYDAEDFGIVSVRVSQSFEHVLTETE